MSSVEKYQKNNYLNFVISFLLLLFAITVIGSISCCWYLAIKRKPVIIIQMLY
jgi:hypothetical protein